MNQNKVWKPIKGFEGLYEICSDGTVRSIGRYINSRFGKRFIHPTIKKPIINPYGYYSVNLYKNNVCHTKLIHRMIMEAFVSNPENKPCIDHINTIRTDNRIENLRWVTHHENTQNPLTIQHLKDACQLEEIQRQIQVKKDNGTWNAKKVYQYSKDGVFIAEHESMSEAIRTLGVKSIRTTGNIKKALDNTKKSAYGYIWTTEKRDVSPYSKSHGKYAPVKQIDSNGQTIREWLCVDMAAKAIGINASNLTKVIRHRNGLYKGMIFKYVE